MDLKYMRAEDREFVMEIDAHVSDLQFEHRVYTKTGYIIWDGSQRAGLMHYTVLWDHIPFLNLIYVKEAYRNRGIAAEAMKRWEEDMKDQGYQMVLISTQVDEDAQYLYRKAGYTECGALLMNGTPFEQPMEMFMRKIIR
ncbi:MAG: GNAT family N-acetyltransferase [Lachnospiraceae bacterium]|nr:GNAT family N-acetyltransferase [Lachnospiraceae bacterium]